MSTQDPVQVAALHKALDRLLQYEADVAKYDKAHIPDFLRAVLYLYSTMTWLSIRDAHMVRRLAEFISCPAVILGADLVRLLSTWLSGFPFTTEINTLLNAFHVFGAINLATDIDPSGEPLVGANRDLDYASRGLGDDLAIGIDDDVPYNQFVDWFKYGFNHTVTPGDKSDRLTLAVSDIAFLKRKFRFVDGEWRMQLDTRSIMRSTRWLRPTNEILEVCTSICRSVVLESYPYGREKYDEAKSRAEAVFTYYSLPIVLKTYEQMSVAVRSPDIWGDIAL